MGVPVLQLPIEIAAEIGVLRQPLVEFVMRGDSPCLLRHAFGWRCMTASRNLGDDADRLDLADLGRSSVRIAAHRRVVYSGGVTDAKRL